MTEKVIEGVTLHGVDELNRVLVFAEDLARQGFQVTISGDLNITVNTNAPETTTVETEVESG